IPGVFAQDAETDVQAMFEDMPEANYWSYASLSAAVENGLLNGFDEDGASYIKPDAALTRAQMATIVNRAFGAKVAASLSGVTDVPSDAWYANEMAKAIQMGTFMRDAKMRPNDSITRQEAFVVLARAFLLKDKDATQLNVFSDKAQIASWAQLELSAMTAAGYIQGSGGMLHPVDSITRAEFATVMDNMVKQYIDTAGTYTEVVAEGNVVIRVSGVTLDGVDVDGDLVIGDGVGDGDAFLNDIAVSGRALIRGGGENSVVFSGSDTDVRNIVISRSADGRVRILTEDGAVLAEAEVAGDSDVILEGTFGSVTVVSDAVTVTASNATITDIAVSGQDSIVILSGTTTVETVTVSGDNSAITVNSGATVDSLVIDAEGVDVTNEGTIEETTTTGEEEEEEEPISGGGGGGGGGTTPQLALSLPADPVKYNGAPATVTDGIYSIGTDIDLTEVDVIIGNIRTGFYDVTFSIANSTTNEVIYTVTKNVPDAYLTLLDGVGYVTFADIVAKFDDLGTTPTDLDAGVRDAFAAMTTGQAYTVKIQFAGSAAGTFEIKVQKN
ncbi:MAG: S-layer homology domain-containing protein, partial [Clostridiales bacterium]|nr:S-layer homology domain-containing protein [Clostridiales bacterium]